MGVEHVIRPDGRVLVLRQHVEQLFGAKAEADRGRRGPDCRGARLADPARSQVSEDRA
ncbi:hypothetical protein [Paraburkholderia caledonica]|uniref:hypothetical protein n=1 Tax=Paraburkholderia caledonica TaxID=134536 RepID=UPI0037094C0E